MTGLSVIIPTHNPDPGRLAQTLAGLRAQSLPSANWELLVVDNGSTRFPDAAFLEGGFGRPPQVVREPRLGLSHARARGFRAAEGRHFVLVDDDNVLAPDYLERVEACFAAHPDVGVLGGKSLPSFEAEPPSWANEFFPLLALRDLGGETRLSPPRCPDPLRLGDYPDFAPIGAGMALRREAAEAWLARGYASGLSDRKGGELSSGGDNDIVLCALEAGWRAAYIPELALRHLIPAARLQPGYLERLNRGIQKSWMQVLALHGINPWSPLSRMGAALRIAKAWFTRRAWSSPAARIRFAGARGHFEGRVGLPAARPIAAFRNPLP